MGLYATATGESTLVERWNGSAWKLVASPSPMKFNFLTTVASVSSKSAWAVGSQTAGTGEAPLFEHWDGTSWSVVSSPTLADDDVELSGLSPIPGTSKLWATGYVRNGGVAQGAIIEQWDGSQWNVVTPNGTTSSGDRLYAVSASTATHAWAVGSHPTTTTEKTLVDRYS